MKTLSRWMKKTLPVLCAGLLLTSCSASGSSTASSVPQSASAPAVQKEPASSLTMLTHPQGFNWNYNTQTDAGFYQIIQLGLDGCNILYTDFETRTRVFLCSRPECAHRDDSCTSWFSNTNGGFLLMAAEDSLYFIQIGTSMENGTEDDRMHLWRMDLDGSNRKLLYTFDNLHHLDAGVATNGETLYFPVAVWTEDLSERNVKLGAFHLETLEFELLCDLNDVYLIGCSGSELFFTKTTQLGYRPETINELAQNPVSGAATIQFTALNVDTLQWRNVGDAAPRYSPTLEGDRLLWIDGEDFSLQQMNLAGTEVTQITNQLPIDANTQILSFNPSQNTLSLSLMHRGETSDTAVEYWLVDLNSGEITAGTPVLFHSSVKNPVPAPIFAEYKDMYLIVNKEEQVPSVYYDTDGTAVPVMQSIGRLSLIDKKEYWQGSDTSVPITDTVLKAS